MEYYKVGKIINTRGIKGELKVKSLTDFTSDRFATGNTVYVKKANDYIPFKVKSFNSVNHQDILVFDKNEDINLVEQYKGCDLYVDDTNETTLYEDEYHLSEILGVEVYQKDQLVGIVDDVKDYPQGDYLDVVLESGKHALIPFRDEFILDVDLENNRIDVVDMEGLI